MWSLENYCGPVIGIFSVPIHFVVELYSFSNMGKKMLLSFCSYLIYSESEFYVKVITFFPPNIHKHKKTSYQ